MSCVCLLDGDTRQEVLVPDNAHAAQRCCVVWLLLVSVGSAIERQSGGVVFRQLCFLSCFKGL